jgi:DNA-binding response OmpR family regulator
MASEIPHLRVLAPAGDREAACKSIRRFQPEIAVLSSLPHNGGTLELVKTLRQAGDPPVVIVLADLHHCQYRQSFLGAGADVVLDCANDFPRLFHVLAELARESNGNPPLTRDALRRRVRQLLDGIAEIVENRR